MHRGNAAAFCNLEQLVGDQLQRWFSQIWRHREQGLQGPGAGLLLADADDVLVCGLRQHRDDVWILGRQGSQRCRAFAELDDVRVGKPMANQRLVTLHHAGTYLGFDLVLLRLAVAKRA